MLLLAVMQSVFQSDAGGVVVARIMQLSCEGRGKHQVLKHCREVSVPGIVKYHKGDIRSSTEATGRKRCRSMALHTAMVDGNGAIVLDSTGASNSCV